MLSHLQAEGIMGGKGDILNLNSPLLAARNEFRLEVKILFKAKVRC